MIAFDRRTFIKTTGAVAGALLPLAAPPLVQSSRAAGTVKLGCLFSSSGTMTNLEGRMNFVAKMAAEEVKAAGGVNNQAYMLCSLAGNLRVTQLVDGNKGIHMMLPKSMI